MKKRLYIITGMLLMAGFAGASVIWSDDFESGLSKWGTVGTVSLEANPDGEGNVLHLKADEVANLAAATSVDMGVVLGTSSEFHVEFDVYFPTNAWMQTFRIFSGYGAGPDVLFRWSEDHRSSSFDYTPDVREDAGYQYLTTPVIPAETWTTIYIDAPGDGTYDLYVGSYSNYIGRFDLIDGDWSKIYLGETYVSYYSGEYYIDNITITDTDISPVNVLLADDFEGGDFAEKWPSVWSGGNGTVGVGANPDGDGNVLHIKSQAGTDSAAVQSASMTTTLTTNTQFHVEFDVYFPEVATMGTFQLFAGQAGRFGPSLLFRATETHTAGGDYTFDYQDDAGYHYLTNSTIPATTWTKVYLDAIGDGNYDIHVGSYTNKIGTFDLRDGDWNQVFFGETSTSIYSGEYYLDNLRITDTYQDQEQELLTGYAAWAVQWGGTNVIGSGSADYDEDGLANIYEYGLGGNPTDELDQGTAPQFSVVNVGGSNVCSYIHPQLSDPESGLTYALALTTNLVADNWVTNTGYIVSGTNVTGETLDFVTNLTDTVDREKFIRLIIE